MSSSTFCHLPHHRLSVGISPYLPYYFYPKLINVCSVFQRRRVSEIWHIIIWVISRTRQRQTHISRLFTRKVSTGLACASFQVSSIQYRLNSVFILPISSSLHKYNIVTDYFTITVLLYRQKEIVKNIPHCENPSCDHCNE